MEQFLNRILRASWPIKIGAIAAISAAVTGLTWFFSIEPAQAKIERAERQRKELEADYIDKQQIADNLNEYRRQKAELEAKLKDTLAELPLDKAIDELLRQFEELGIANGLEILSVVPGAEASEKFFARIPVKMRVIGRYHDVASFFDQVGKLKRIVNVEDIELGKPTVRAEKVVLSADFTATTFRYLEPSEAKKSKKDAPKGKRR